MDKPTNQAEPMRTITTAQTIAAALAVVVLAALAGGLYRFGFFKPKPTEERIARNLDFADPLWPEQLLEISLPSCRKDFAVYSAFFYSGTENTLTLVYTTQAGLDEIRGHYRDLLENPLIPESNGPGVLELEGSRGGRKVRVRNYFSEVSRLVQVELELEGGPAALIREKVLKAFPENALEAVPEIAAFAAGESSEGYVMYNYNTFASDVYPNIPLFSRAYTVNGSSEELRERINALRERFTDPARALIGGGTAEIKHGPWLYQIKPVESPEKTEAAKVKAALIIQAIPEH